MIGMHESAPSQTTTPRHSRDLDFLWAFQNGTAPSAQEENTELRSKLACQTEWSSRDEYIRGLQQEVEPGPFFKPRLSSMWSDGKIFGVGPKVKIFNLLPVGLFWAYEFGESLLVCKIKGSLAKFLKHGVEQERAKFAGKDAEFTRLLEETMVRSHKDMEEMNRCVATRLSGDFTFYPLINRDSKKSLFYHIDRGGKFWSSDSEPSELRGICPLFVLLVSYSRFGLRVIPNRFLKALSKRLFPN